MTKPSGNAGADAGARDLLIRTLDYLSINCAGGDEDIGPKLCDEISTALASTGGNAGAMEADTPEAVLNGIRDALETRGYFHMANGRDIGILLDKHTPSPGALDPVTAEPLTDWLDQQIENAREDQIAGFKIATAAGQLKGERAHARHCAMYEAKQQVRALIGQPAPTGNAIELSLAREQIAAALELFIPSDLFGVKKFRAADAVLALYAAPTGGASKPVTSTNRHLTDDQIKHMVDRFLGWRLPKDFSPDAGISYTRPNYAPSVDATPSGTNLFDATQADAMVRYMVDGLFTPPMRHKP